MSMTKALLERGYFPKELPPPFTTAIFAANYAGLASPNSKDSSCLRYSYSKYATVRRTLSIPNPAHMIPLADAVAQHWLAIDIHCTRSTISRTRPKLDATRVLAGKHNLDGIPSARAEIRTGARYVVVADVSNFYGSVYTHAIPWAFHTKPVAKNDRSPRQSNGGGPPLFGNVIDLASRNIQSGQTIGLPIGPDTSLAIAESVLCAVDNLVSTKIPSGTLGFRFIDDYEFSCMSLGDAELIRAVLQDSLAEFELQLNPRKTRIIELPDILDTAWVHDLASFNLGSPKKEVLESQLLRYFSRAFELMRQNPGEPVLKYAVRRLSEVDLTRVRPLLQRLLFQAAAVDPGTLHTALYIAFRDQERNGPGVVDKEVLRRALSSIIQRHAPLQHGGDVAWALWGAIVFQVTLDDPTVDALEKLEDPIAALMALHAEQDGRLNRALSKTRWETFVNPLELFDTRWLLVYEGVGQNWLAPASGDPAMSDPFFADARAKGISFYDASVARKIPEPSAPGTYS